MKVVQPDGRQGHHRAKGHRELRVGGKTGAPHLGAVWDGRTGNRGRGKGRGWGGGRSGGGGH